MQACSYREVSAELPILTCRHPRVRAPRGEVWPAVCDACPWADGKRADGPHGAPVAERGLGDSVARWLARWGVRKRAGCGCSRRQEKLNRLWPYRSQSRSRDTDEASLLLRFPHGLGDAVQMTVVLAHLRELRPQWQIDMAGKRGAHSLWQGLCRQTIAASNGHEFDASRLNDAEYDRVRTVPWPEPNRAYADSPSTKAERCLREVFGLQPIERLCRYQIQVDDDSHARAERFLQDRCGQAATRFPVVLIHYQGNSAQRSKNLDEQIVRDVVRTALRHGRVPMILDFETRPRSGLLPMNGVGHVGAHESLWKGYGMGDGVTLAALIAQVELFVGIDSGPGHIAGATETPTLIAWRRHHPVHYYGLSPNVTHVVPRGHTRWIRGSREIGTDYFYRRYQHHVCTGHLRDELPDLVSQRLTDNDTRGDRINRA